MTSSIRRPVRHRRRARVPKPLVVVVALLGIALASLPNQADAASFHQSVRNSTHDYVSSRTNFKLPPGTWRPFADNSWVNRPLPANPKIDPRSQTYVTSLITHNDPNSSGIPRAITPITAEDYQHPLYFNNARPGLPSTDPVYLPVCDRNGGCNGTPGANNGREAVHIPCGAKPANGTDGQFVVIDQYTNKTYELGELFASVNPNLAKCSGGTLHVRFSSTTSLSGDGRNTCVVAACVSALAGQIRAQEMAAATAAHSAIRHALYVVDVGCQRYSVYPAWHENYCDNVGPQWAPIGQFFKLTLTPAQINAGNYPAWQKTILKTMSRYGMYVGDQGANNAFELMTESQFTYSSFGKPNPWTAFISSQGASDSLGFTNLGTQFWLDHLVAIDPCVIQRTC